MADKTGSKPTGRKRVADKIGEERQWIMNTF